jgi:c-di-GMP-binding flagellar brake protein YcgR
MPRCRGPLRLPSSTMNSMERSNAKSGSEYESRYEIHSSSQIVALMRGIQRHNQLVTLTIVGGTDAFVTSILEIDDQQNVLVLDSAPSEQLNRKFIDAEIVFLETTFEKVRISFSSTLIDACVHEGRPALLMEIPASLVRLQRREFYRIATPRADPVRCSIPVPEYLGNGVVTLSLVDISCGGVAAMVDDGQVLDETIGRQYENCRIDLPGVSTVWTGLQIRGSQEIVLPNGRRRRRLGFEFVNLPAAMLAAVQRYIMKLEREQNAKASGLR